MSFSLGKFFGIIHRETRRFFRKELPDVDFSKGLFRYIIELYKNEGITQKELGDLLKVDKSTTTRAVKKLNQSGYLDFRNDKKDGRIKRLFLTSKGKKIRKEIFKVSDKWTEILTDDFSEEEKKILEKMLNKLIENAKEYKEE